MSDWKFLAVVLFLLFGISFLMYSAYKPLHDVHQEFVYDGWTCLKQKEPSGPAHTRDTYYYCTKENEDPIQVQVFGKIRTEESRYWIEQ